MRPLVVLLGLLLLAGCTGDPAPPPPTAPTSTARPPKPAPHPPAPRVPDRNDRAVLDALASLNPCALVKGDHVRLWGPHRCTLTTGGAAVEVAFTERTERATRFSLPTKVIGGVKVDSIKKTYDLCSMEIPVSFNYAVAVSAGTCAVLDDVAATVISRLAKPAKVRHPADRPDLSKDACDVLAKATADAGLADPETGVRHRVAFDICEWDVPKLGLLHLQFFFQGAPPPDQVWSKSAPIAGRTVYVNGCQWLWNEGSYSSTQDRSVGFDADCRLHTIPPDLVDKLVTAMMKRLDAPQPPLRVTKLTYRAGEADEPNPGACVDYPLDACEPYQPTPVPAGAAAATRMAQVDSHVTCAAAVDAVRARFPALRPVVDTQQRTCVFVQPDHALQLSFDVQASDVSAYQPVVSRELTVGGRPAEYREYKDPPTTSLCVDSGQRSAYRTTNLLWCVTATFRPPRGDPSARVDTGGGAGLAPVMAALVAEYLG